MFHFTRDKSLIFHIVIGIFMSVMIYYMNFIFNSLGNTGKIPIILSIFALFCFFLGYYESVLIKLFNLAELSNISIFGHYYIIKKVQNRNAVLLSSIFEFLTYTYLRVFCITQIIIDNYEIVLFSPLSILLVIYYMSIDWSYTLFNNLKSELLSI